MATICMLYKQYQGAFLGGRPISFECMTIMNHSNKCCSVSMLHKTLEPERIDDKCNILPKIILICIQPTKMVFLLHQTRHPSDIKR